MQAALSAGVESDNADAADDADDDRNDDDVAGPSLCEIFGISLAALSFGVFRASKRALAQKSPNEPAQSNSALRAAAAAAAESKRETRTRKTKRGEERAELICILSAQAGLAFIYQNWKSNSN